MANLPIPLPGDYVYSKTGQRLQIASIRHDTIYVFGTDDRGWERQMSLCSVSAWPEASKDFTIEAPRRTDLTAKKERTDGHEGIIAVLRLLIEAAESSTCMSGHRTIEHKHINELKSALAAMDSEGK